jgi:hypothetical protein
MSFPARESALGADRGNKKERAPGGTHSQKPTGSNPIVMRCRYGQVARDRPRKYSDFTQARKLSGAVIFAPHGIRPSIPFATNCGRWVRPSLSMPQDLPSGHMSHWGSASGIDNSLRRNVPPAISGRKRGQTRKRGEVCVRSPAKGRRRDRDVLRRRAVVPARATGSQPTNRSFRFPN